MHRQRLAWPCALDVCFFTISEKQVYGVQYSFSQLRFFDSDMSNAFPHHSIALDCDFELKSVAGRSDKKKTHELPSGKKHRRCRRRAVLWMGHDLAEALMETLGSCIGVVRVGAGDGARLTLRSRGNSPETNQT